MCGIRVVTSVEPMGAAGEEEMKPTEAMSGVAAGKTAATMVAIGDNRTDWRMAQMAVSRMA